ncbi:MAG TPA: hypothetical protein VIR29_11575, partial [Anseongella sp.]
FFLKFSFPVFLVESPKESVGKAGYKGNTKRWNNKEFYKTFFKVMTSWHSARGTGKPFLPSCTQ